MYNKKMAAQNKAAAAQAGILLTQAGWSAETEEYTDAGKLSDVTLDQINAVADQIQAGLPDMPPDRIKHQITGVMARVRGKARKK
jgi:hypothetical protein